MLSKSLSQSLTMRSNWSTPGLLLHHMTPHGLIAGRWARGIEAKMFRE